MTAGAAFHPFDYLHFARTEMQGAAHELCMSGVSDAPDDLFAVDTSDVPFHGEDAALCAALAARYGVPSGHVLPALGTSGGVFLALAALITLVRERGSEPPHVAIEAPAYGCFESAARFAGARTSALPRPAAERFAVDPGRVERAFAQGADVVCVTDLHNPSGVLLPADVADALHAAAARHGAWLLLDEVYRDFRPGPVGTGYRPGGRVVATSSLTKCYGLGPVRAGWIFGAPEVVARADRVREVVHGVDPVPTLRAALAGLRAADRLLDRARRVARRARPVMDAWVADEERVDWVPPDAGLTGLVDVHGCADSLALTRALRRDLDVQVVPGAFFGAEGTLRLSFGLPPARLSRALETLSLGLGALLP